MTKLSDGHLISSPCEITKFRGPRNVQDQNCSDQWLERFCKDFNTGKNDQVTKRKFWEKKIFPLKSMTKLEDLTVFSTPVIPPPHSQLHQQIRREAGNIIWEMALISTFRREASSVEESIEWFIEEQAFLLSYDLAPPPPTSPPHFPTASRLLYESSCVSPVGLTRGERGEGVEKEPNHTSAIKPPGPQ